MKPQKQILVFILFILVFQNQAFSQKETRIKNSGNYWDIFAEVVKTNPETGMVTCRDNRGTEVKISLPSKKYYRKIKSTVEVLLFQNTIPVLVTGKLADGKNSRNH